MHTIDMQQKSITLVRCEKSALKKNQVENCPVVADKKSKELIAKW